ncbi:MAG TPA: hypothetical protein VKM96_00470 [Candidatus Bathyarchaeia archaeon]|nr:hypothetical protein [Candidatus Bathyarchaeia archaeon]
MEHSIYFNTAAKPVKTKMMNLRILSSTIVLVALSLFLGLPSLAHADNGESQGAFVNFFHSTNAEAGWVQFTPTPAGDPDMWSIRLNLGAAPSTCPPPNYVNCPYAGAALKGVPGAPPSTPPSFDYYSTVAGDSGGSPRLHIDFSDGGSMDLRPLVLTANTWTHVDGSGTLWDNNGGTCGFLYGTTYSIALACHSSGTVTGVIVVTDSAWLFTSGYTHYIDNISYGSIFVTSPSPGCHESDGGGDFQGDHGKGNVAFDHDGCMDGDQDSVQSTDRGDSRDFQSSQISTAQYDPIANTLTVTGLGTSRGVPISFILVALATGPTTPGWVSFSFSDGYTNAGNLVNGSIVLQ